MGYKAFNGENMKRNKSILEKLAGLCVVLENISETQKMVIEIRPVDSAPMPRIKKQTAKPYFRMKEKW